MNNFWVVFSHTYLTKIKSRQFILTTVITLLIILAMANITKIIGTIQEITGEDGKTKIALVDETNGLGESFKEILIAINPVFEIQTAGTNYEELKNHVFEGELEAYIQLSLNDAGIPKVVYYSDSLTDFVLPSQVEAALQQLKTSV
ncbi:MAG TPA: ABC transporter permease, partial [Bacillota bacterium]|nr:ABC transporter permease [Bacillota bacterium]